MDVSDRSYETLECPAFPQYGDMEDWMTQLRHNVVASAPYTDLIEIKWLNECTTKTFAELACAGSARLKRLDLMLSMCVAQVIHKSSKQLSEQVFLADQDAADQDQILGGRQMVWMILNFFKTHRSMQEQ